MFPASKSGFCSNCEKLFEQKRAIELQNREEERRRENERLRIAEVAKKAEEELKKKQDLLLRNQVNEEEQRLREERQRDAERRLLVAQDRQRRDEEYLKAEEIRQEEANKSQMSEAHNNSVSIVYQPDNKEAKQKSKEPKEIKSKNMETQQMPDRHLDVKETSKEHQYQVGEAVYFGVYPQIVKKQLPVKWHIISIENDTGLLLADSILDLQVMSVSDGIGVHWIDSDLRQWMNTTMLSALFNKAEKRAILTQYITNTDLNGTKHPSTADKLFLLDYKEFKALEQSMKVAVATQYCLQHSAKLLIINNESSKENESPLLWWLRTTGKTTGSILVVNDSGSIESVNGDETHHVHGIRPAMYVNLSLLNSIIAKSSKYHDVEKQFAFAQEEENKRREELKKTEKASYKDIATLDHQNSDVELVTEQEKEKPAQDEKEGVPQEDHGKQEPIITEVTLERASKEKNIAAKEAQKAEEEKQQEQRSIINNRIIEISQIPVFEDRFGAIIQAFPELRSERRIFFGLMKDFFPLQRKEINLLTSVYDLGIISEFEKASLISNTFAYRFVKRMIDEYGVSKLNANWAVSVWCVYYGKKYLNLPCEVVLQGSNTSETITNDDPFSNDNQYTKPVYHFRTASDGYAVYGISDKKISFLNVPALYNGMPVTRILPHAFELCVASEAFLPEGIVSIGKEAFCHCHELKRVIIPSSLQSIGDSAFCDCAKLKTITLHKGLKIIGDSAFAGTALRQINMPDTLTKIGRGAFRHCSSLTTINLPKYLNSIPEKAFSDCVSISKIEIPNNVHSIGSEAFAGCSSLLFLVVPRNVLSIGDNAFDRMDPRFTLICAAGTIAEQYARTHKVPYQIVG